MSFNENATLDTSQVESGGSGGFGGGGGGRGGFPGGIQVGGGIGGLIMLILMLIFGGGLTGGGNTTAPQDSTTTQGGQFDTSQVGAAGSASGDFANCKTGADANKNDECLIIATVNSVQAYWGQLLPQYGKQYPKAKTVIYSGQTQSGCGTASNQVGPFYCPLDKKVYIDASFFAELTKRFGSRRRTAGQGVRRGARVRPPHPERPRPARQGAAGPAGPAVRRRARRAHG
jgi:predicted metalloprotease